MSKKGECYDRDILDILVNAEALIHSCIHLCIHSANMYLHAYYVAEATLLGTEYATVK